MDFDKNKIFLQRLDEDGNPIGEPIEGLPQSRDALVSQDVGGYGRTIEGYNSGPIFFSLKLSPGDIMKIWKEFGLLAEVKRSYLEMSKRLGVKKLELRCQREIFDSLNAECHQLYNCNLKRWAKQNRLHLKFYKRLNYGFVKI